jgi:thiol-disulfide isomerase/thioredoxin
MKHLRFALTLFLLATGNISKGQHLIVGTLQHLDNQMVYLKFVNDSLQKQTDSVYAWEGRFVFRGTITEPTQATVVSTDGKLNFDFFFEKGTTVLTGDLDISPKCMIYGGATSRTFKSFMDMDEPYVFLRDSLSLQMYKQRQAGDSTGALATQNHFTEIIAQSKAMEREFITKNNHSPVSAFLLSAFYVRPGTWEKGDSLMLLLTDDALQSKYVRYREAQIAKLRKLEPGKPVVPFSQTDKNGKRFSTLQLKGRYYLIEFWASWCAPCRKENPELLKVYTKYQPKGFEIVAVSLDTDRNKWLEAISKDQLPWIQVSDLKGWKNAVAQTYEVNMIPYNFLIDKNGNIIAHSIRPDELNKKLAALYKKQ